MIPLPERGPIEARDRAAFVLRRYTEYKDALVEGSGCDATNPKYSRLYARLKELADWLAREDLQALLGRRGPEAQDIETGCLIAEREADLERERAIASVRQEDP